MPRAGAAAISVLTDSRYFQGQLEYLAGIKERLREIQRAVPVLRKDFIYHDYQVYEARMAGADALLLIVGVLGDSELAHLLQPDAPIEDAGPVEVDDLIRRANKGEEVPRYDYVFGDTFNDYSVPYHLTTVEFTRALDALMSERGLYMLNMIDRFDSGRFLAAIIATFRDVFPGVCVFFCHRNLTSRGTYVVVGSKRLLNPSDLADLNDRLKRHPDFFGFQLTDEQVTELLNRTSAQPLTDDHAPVENLLADVVRRDYPDGLDLHHLKAGLREAGKGRMDSAIRRFERALEINPGNAQALYNLGVAWMTKGDSEQALRAFGAALELDPDYVDVRNNAGVVLAGLGMLDEAAGQFEEIIRRRPEAVDARVNLAALRAQAGKTEEAKVLLKEVLRLDPSHAQARQNLRAMMGR